MSLIIEGGITIGGGISITPVSEVDYTAGLYKRTYAGYFADNVNFFATATITKTTNVTGKVFYNSATNGF